MINYEELATSIESMREMLRAMVAGLTVDGFTEEQARELVVAMFKSVADKKEDDE